MLEDEFLSESVEPFVEENFIEDVIQVLKSGKEATVCLCRAHASHGGGLVALKIYRPVRHRSFRNEAAYRDGRVLKGRFARALANKSDFGREVQMGTWVHYEWETMRLLHHAGADTPRPVATRGQAILMEYVGDDAAPAPQLRTVDLSPQDATRVFERLMCNVELLLANNCIHGDLSPYNVLYWKESPTIIDFPQSVDARENPNAFALLTRDIDNIHRHCARFTDELPANPLKLAIGLWERYLMARL